MGGSSNDWLHAYTETARPAVKYSIHRDVPLLFFSLLCSVRLCVLSGTSDVSTSSHSVLPMHPRGLTGSSASLAFTYFNPSVCIPTIVASSPNHWFWCRIIFVPSEALGQSFLIPELSGSECAGTAGTFRRCPMMYVPGYRLLTRISNFYLGTAQIHW